MIDPALHDATRHDACEPFRWPCVTPQEFLSAEEYGRRLQALAASGYTAEDLERARRQLAEGSYVTLDGDRGSPGDN